MSKLFAASSALVAALVMGDARAQELFDFEGPSGDGADFNGAITEFSNSGNYIWTGNGGIQENTSVAFMFNDDPAITNGELNPLQATTSIVDLADNTQFFSVNSLDWRAFSPSGGATASLVGYSGSVEAWRIDGPFEIDPPETIFAPTSGDFGTSITSIVWDIPDYTDGSFGHVIDNLSVNIDAPPAGLEVFDFEGPAGDGADFNGLISEPSNSGNTTLSGAGSFQENSSVGFMFQDSAEIPNGTVNPIRSVSQVLDSNDNPQTFTVFSLDWRSATVGGGDTASLIGYSGGEDGTEQWRIDGPFDLDPAETFFAPTSGSFTNEIDTIVWDIPDYLDGRFGQVLDNLQVLLSDTGGGGLEADFNNDGIVDLLDLDILGQNWQMAGTTSTGDANGDGTVDLLDLDILGQQWQQEGSFEAALAATGIPEPGSIALLGLGGLAVLRRRK